ncbi:LCP family protein [Streptomyces sp. NPDC003717]|uniref:LCP family protein n=1 Tax=Streptomyces sp. NPDC003717 TaxID=3154276 RepID=UPI0033A2B681
MNDRHDAGYGAEGYGADGYGAEGYELVGYDEYGNPVYRQAPAAYDPYAQQQAPQQQYDPQQYGQYYGQQGQQGYGYDPYAPGAQQPPYPYDQAGYDPQQSYARPTAEQTAHIPQQAGPPAEPEPAAAPGPEAAAPDYRTEQFAFVEEPTDDSEDVIDWLAFTENRTERREEARRRARSRVIALVVVLALVAVGGAGWLWYAGKLPGTSSGGDDKGAATAAGAQQRDVIAVHLHDTKKGGTSTALLVNNTTTKRGTVVLLPNALTLTGDDGTPTTLAKSVAAGPDPARTALDTALGTDIEGSWRLDTPYLQNLVDLVGTIEADTDADVPDPAAKKKGQAPLVHKGERQTLSGKAAVAYATYRGPGESADAQLKRFGQVMQGVLRKLSSDPQGATTTVQTLGMILDPPLTDRDLGTFLAGLSDLAKGGDFTTTTLPVGKDGRLGAEAADGVVKEVLGGTATNPDKDAAVSVWVRDATGAKGSAGKARVTLLNGGFTFLEGGTATGTESTSRVVYADAADRENAAEVAKTLGLPAGAVTKGEVAANARVAVTLGQDYKPAS